MKPLPGPKPYTIIITQFSADFDLHQHHCGSLQNVQGHRVTVISVEFQTPLLCFELLNFVLAVQFKY